MANRHLSRSIAMQTLFEWDFHGKKIRLKEAIRWGAANGASVVEHIGPQAGLLSYTKMQEKLKENSKIVAREI